MTKDWKAEYDKLRGEKQELEKLVKYYQSKQEVNLRAEDTLNKFKDLLVEVLGS